MPWKECSAVEERLRFVARLLDGEAMTDLAREFGISRKTGYKIFDRYKQHGLEALCRTSATKSIRGGAFERASCWRPRAASPRQHR